MKKSIRMSLFFSMIVFCMFIGSIVLNVDADETTATISDTCYTVTIPSSVSVDTDSLSGSIPVSVTTTDDFSNNYKELNVKVSSNSSYQLKNTSNDSYSIHYTISEDTLSFFSASDAVEKSFGLSVSSDDLNSKISNGLISGTYTDTLTFNISGTKNTYYLDLNGTVDGNDVQDGGDFSGVATVDTYINDTNVGTNNVGWWNCYEAGTTFKFVVSYDSKKYSLDRVEDNNGNLATNYGMSVVIDNDAGTATISGVISGQNAITKYEAGYTTRVDLCFTTKTYDLTLDYYKLEMDESTSYECEKDGETFTRYKKTIKDVKYGADISEYLPKDLTTDKDEDIGVVYLGWHTEDQPSSGWKDIEESKRFTSTTMPASDTTLYTWWTKTIYLDLDGQLEGEDKADGGDMSGFATADINVNNETKKISVTDAYIECQYGDNYKITATPNLGYTYVGVSNPYNLSETPGLIGTIHRKNAVNLFISDSSKANQWAVKVNLVFRRNTFTVKFNSNDGEGTMSDQSFSYGKKTEIDRMYIY